MTASAIVPWAVDLLGWAAGICIMVSGLPAVIGNLRRTGQPKPSLLRDILQCMGNVGWVSYGLLIGSIPLAVMCAISTVIMGVLIAQHRIRGPDGSRVTPFPSTTPNTGENR